MENKYYDFNEDPADSGVMLVDWVDNISGGYEEFPEVYSVEAATALLEKFVSEGKVTEKRAEEIRKKILESHLVNNWTLLDIQNYPDLYPGEIESDENSGES